MQPKIKMTLPAGSTEITAIHSPNTKSYFKKGTRGIMP